MQYPTTNNATNGSVLALLRALVPQRPLTLDESLRIAGLQANRLLEHFAIASDAVPEEIVSELPRLRVEREHDLPVSGAANWNGQYWIITLNADETPYRQRFSLMHEFKHIVDHTTKHFLYSERRGSTAYDQAERVANYFAACLLMPKRVIKREWCSSSQDLTTFADRFRVSPIALRYRLQELGLVEPAPRCGGPIHRNPRVRPVRSSTIGAAPMNASRQTTPRFTIRPPLAPIGEPL